VGDEQQLPLILTADMTCALYSSGRDDEAERIIESTLERLSEAECIKSGGDFRNLLFCKASLLEGRGKTEKAIDVLLEMLSMSQSMDKYEHWKVLYHLAEEMV